MTDQPEKYFVAKLLSPRPGFPMDMTQDEENIMIDHTEYWKALMNNGDALITGPVLDPEGAYGLGILVAGSHEEAIDLLKDDPARKVSEYEIYEMLAVFPDEIE